MSRDQLLADLRRALSARFPEAHDRLVRDIELRLSPQRDRRPVMSRAPLLDAIESALRIAFPDRADALLEELRERMADDPDDDFPSLVVAAPPASRYFALRLPLMRERMVLGRSVSCDFHLQEPTLQPRHAEIVRDPQGRVVLQDLSGADGTFVNDSRIEHAELHDGDHIRCGTIVFRFVVDGASRDRS